MQPGFRVGHVGPRRPAFLRLARPWGPAAMGAPPRLWHAVRHRMSPRQTNAQMSEATRADLIAKARRAFAEHGYAQAPIEDVVQACGLTRGALYHHFGSKQGLFLAVVAELERELLSRIDQKQGSLAGKAAPRRRTARDRGGADDATALEVEDFLEACRLYLEATMAPDVRRILLVDAPAVLAAAAASPKADAAAIEAIQSAAVAPIAQALQELRASGYCAQLNLDATARMLGGALFEAALWVSAQPRPARALEVAMQTFAALVRGLATG